MTTRRHLVRPNSVPQHACLSRPLCTTHTQRRAGGVPEAGEDCLSPQGEFRSQRKEYRLLGRGFVERAVVDQPFLKQSQPDGQFF
jgi:hypothetical protein